MSRLTVDLRLNGASAAPDGEQALTLRELVALVGTPAKLIHRLRDSELNELFVLRDDRPLSGVQAGALAIATLGHARRVTVSSPTRTVASDRRAARLRSMTALAGALPTELVRSVRWHARARRLAATPFVLPARPPAEIGRITYLRAEPSLRWFGAQVGGAATHTAGVVNGLARAGIEVNVFASEAPSDLRGVRCHAVPPQHLVQLVYWLTLAGYAKELVDAACHTPADLVYQRYALGSCAGLELAQRLGVPFVLEFNGSGPWTERHWGSGRVQLAKTLAAIERRNLLDASLIVVVSRALETELVDQGIDPSRILVNPNGVDVEELAAARADPPERWRARTGLPEAPTVGFVGTFGLWHGVKLLPEMIERVARRRDDARWVLIGDGLLHGEVAAEIERRGLSDRVLLTGVVEHSRTVELLASCDVCVSPHVPNPDGTPFFGSPTKLFEYMGLARAIVASELDQIGEVLDDGRTALLTDPGDAAMAADAVVRLLDDEPLRARLGQAALEAATREHSWDAHVGRLLQALRDAPERAPPAAALGDSLVG